MTAISSNSVRHFQNSVDIVGLNIVGFSSEIYMGHRKSGHGKIKHIKVEIEIEADEGGRGSNQYAGVSQPPQRWSPRSLTVEPGAQRGHCVKTRTYASSACNVG